MKSAAGLSMDRVGNLLKSVVPLQCMPQRRSKPRYWFGIRLLCSSFPFTIILLFSQYVPFFFYCVYVSSYLWACVPVTLPCIDQEKDICCFLQVEFPEARIYEETLNVLLYETPRVPDNSLLEATSRSRSQASHSEDDDGFELRDRVRRIHVKRYSTYDDRQLGHQHISQGERVWFRGLYQYSLRGIRKQGGDGWTLWTDLHLASCLPRDANGHLYTQSNTKGQGL